MSPNDRAKRILRAENRRWVYLVDDDDELRHCVGAMLASRGFEMTGFESGRRFLRMTDSLPAGCVVADLRMEDGDGFELLQGLKDRRSRFPVIMVTGFADVAIAVRAMKLGAVDFIEKPFSITVLVDVIGSVHERFFPVTVAEEAGAPAVGEDVRQRLATLTPRERNVLDGIVNGWTNKKIALELNISQRTVELHRAHLMEKLGARNVSQLVRLSLLATGQIAVAESAI